MVRLVLALVAATALACNTPSALCYDTDPAPYFPLLAKREYPGRSVRLVAWFRGEWREAVVRGEGDPLVVLVTLQTNADGSCWVGMKSMGLPGLVGPGRKVRVRMVGGRDLEVIQSEGGH